MKTLVQLTLMTLVCAPAFGQWANVPPPAIPRAADGTPNLSAPAPRSADGKPDLSGIWNAPTGYLRNLARDSKEEVPFQAWAKALYDERAAGLHWKDEPDANCLPQGVPKVLLAPAPWRGLVWTQQFMVELANGFERFLQLLIVAQPAAHLGNPLAAQAELPRASPRIAHGENRQRMTFAARALRAALGMIADRPLQQRAAQDLAGHREPVEQLLAPRDGSLTSHSYK